MTGASETNETSSEHRPQRRRRQRSSRREPFTRHLTEEMALRGVDADGRRALARCSLRNLANDTAEYASELMASHLRKRVLDLLEAVNEEKSPPPCSCAAKPGSRPDDFYFDSLRCQSMLKCTRCGGEICIDGTSAASSECRGLLASWRYCQDLSFFQGLDKHAWEYVSYVYGRWD